MVSQLILTAVDTMREGKEYATSVIDVMSSLEVVILADIQMANIGSSRFIAANASGICECFYLGGSQSSISAVSFITKIKISSNLLLAVRCGSLAVIKIKKNETKEN